MVSPISLSCLTAAASSDIMNIWPHKHVNTTRTSWQTSQCWCTAHQHEACRMQGCLLKPTQAVQKSNLLPQWKLSLQEKLLYGPDWRQQNSFGWGLAASPREQQEHHTLSAVTLTSQPYFSSSKQFARKHRKDVEEVSVGVFVMLTGCNCGNQTTWQPKDTQQKVSQDLPITYCLFRQKKAKKPPTPLSHVSALVKQTT